MANAGDGAGERRRSGRRRHCSACRHAPLPGGSLLAPGTHHDVRQREPRRPGLSAGRGWGRPPVTVAPAYRRPLSVTSPPTGRVVPLARAVWCRCRCGDRPDTGAAASPQTTAGRLAPIPTTSCSVLLHRRPQTHTLLAPCPTRQPHPLSWSPGLASHPPPSASVGLTNDDPALQVGAQGAFGGS